ncbi:hypothetical protein BV898_15155 [Hypsibius exemplaris]|uniref:Helitron helicase-like domain-containing protein n=1 Tax=Hypsibius exemplaris TaxID=2072580 RepID=A0A9X6RK55_HYPEX|nr:hypothetical protein BV898_15155 [Hypsibius exemplaris]
MSLLQLNRLHVLVCQRRKPEPSGRISPAGPSTQVHSHAVEREAPVAEDECRVDNSFALPLPPQVAEDQLADQIVQSLIKAPNSNAVPWPVIGGVPVNEFEKNTGFVTKAFPALFPFGTGDLRADRPRQIKPVNYFRHLLKYKDGRYAQHGQFLFFAFNCEVRWRALTQGSVFLQHLSVDDRNMSAEDFRAKYARDPKSMVARILRFGECLRGSRQYWFMEREKLTDLINQEGSPTVFMTFSFADTRCPELHRLMPKGLPDPALPESEKVKHRMASVNKNPLLTAWFLHERFKSYVKNVLKTLFAITISWYRTEWQHRGTGHFHGFLWFEDAPDITDMDGKTADELKQITAYFDKLIITWNVALGAVSPALHPCELSGAQLKDDLGDLGNCQNILLRHTRCAVGRCLVMLKTTLEWICRFNFPFDLSELSAVLKNAKNHWKFMPRRNDPLLNCHNPVLVQTWRANCDFQAIVSMDELKRYITKYASKHDTCSKSFADIFRGLLQDAGKDETVKSSIQKLLIKTVSERDYGAQEVAHLLYSLPLVTCSKQFVKLFLYENSHLRRLQQIRARQPAGENATASDILQHYADRSEEQEELSLREMAINFKWTRQSGWIALAIKDRNILSVLPKLTPDPADAAYCRQRLILEVPWRQLADLDAGFDDWVQAHASHFSAAGWRNLLDEEELP